MAEKQGSRAISLHLYDHVVLYGSTYFNECLRSYALPIIFQCSESFYVDCSEGAPVGSGLIILIVSCVASRWRSSFGRYFETNLGMATRGGALVFAYYLKFYLDLTRAEKYILMLFLAYRLQYGSRCWIRIAKSNATMLTPIMLNQKGNS